MLSASGSAHANVTPDKAISYLADPRHAGEWFDNVTADGLPDGVPHVGYTWRFEAHEVRSTSARAGGRMRLGARPMRLATYVPGQVFAWESALGRWRTNIRWEVTAAPLPAGGTMLTLRVRWRPGPFGWIWAAMAAVVAPNALARRAQRTVERAGAAAEAYPDRQHQSRGERSAARRGRGTRQRRGHRHHG